MAVPFFDVHAVWDEDVRAAVLERWRRVLEHGRFVHGPEITELEGALAAVLGVPAAIGCSNGSDALVLGLRLCDVGPGDEVVVPALTFFATAGAVARVGATPVFADVDPETLTLDPEDAARRAGPRTKAVVPVHLYGRPAPVGPLREAVEAAAGRPVAVVEDAAQAIGAARDGVAVGEIGAAACFSFYPTKNLGALGDGGAVVFREVAAAETAAALRNYGQTARYRHDLEGLNSRLDEIHAAMLDWMLSERLPAWTARRRAIARAYLETIRNPALRLPQAQGGAVWHLFPVRVPADGRGAFMAHLEAEGVQPAIHYPAVIPDQKALAGRGAILADPLDEARRLAEEEVSLPIHPYMTEAEIDRVIAAANGWRP